MHIDPPQVPGAALHFEPEQVSVADSLIQPPPCSASFQIGVRVVTETVPDIDVNLQVPGSSGPPLGQGSGFTSTKRTCFPPYT